MQKSLSHAWPCVAIFLLLWGMPFADASDSGPPTVVFDFEDGWQGWQIGDGDIGNVRRPTAKCPEKVRSQPTGKFLLAIDYRWCGWVDSPVFAATGEEATFLLGGVGGEKAYISLHDAETDHELLRTTVPLDIRDKNADEFTLQRMRWDLSPYVGKPVFVRIVAEPIGYAMNRHGAGGLFHESSVVFDNFQVEGRLDWKANEAMRRRRQREKQASMARIKEQLGEIVFAVRKHDQDSHWYADFGHWSGDPNRLFYHEGTRLCILNAATGKVTTLIDDPRGTIRDPRVHYDGDKLLFSYRPGGEAHFHLYELDIERAADNTPKCGQLRQLTRGDYDDLEPCYFPDGRIIFVSSRCKRFVPCYFTEVAVLHSCDADGGNIRMLSPNVEHENTPWPLPDGRILYTRWEYVERNVLHFHHLWAANPDGRNQKILYGNMHPGYLMIDAKPLPNTGKVVSMFVPGHTRREHAGTVTVVDPSNGPDDKSAIQRVGWSRQERDAYPIGDTGFLIAKYHQLHIMDYEGRSELLWQLSQEEKDAGFWPQEPMPLKPHPREPVIADQIDLNQKTGVLTLTDVYQGRNMDGIEHGSIKKLLVLESLPKALNISNGSEPISRFAHNHERILGTVPVEPDGSASFEIPAGRAIFLAALDQNDIAVKRMQSFLTVQPGEVTSCVGCHEERMQTPSSVGASATMAMRRAPSKIEPINDVPDVFDFHRDIQPIFDRHCIACHDYEAAEQGGPMAGGVILAGDLGPVWAHSYTWLAGRFVTLGSNLGNNAPLKTGSGGSRLMGYLDGSHHDAKLSSHERKMIRLWLDSGAMYAGTLAAEGTGMIYFQIGKQNEQYKVATYDWFKMPDEWPERLKAAREVAQRRCNDCHETNKARKSLPELDVTYFTKDTPVRPRQSMEFTHNFTRPELSLLLLAPLGKSAGGMQFCRDKSQKSGGESVFADKNDPDYKTLHAYMETLHQAQLGNPRYHMDGYRPSPHYLREMKRYGILPADFDERNDPIDPYATDRAYWESFWLK